VKSVTLETESRVPSAGEARRRSKWLRRGLWGLLILGGTAFALGAAAYLWLRYVPPPSLPQSSLLGPVSEVRATAGRGIISVDWTPIPNAICYQVLRSESPGGPFSLASTTYGVLPIVVEHGLEHYLPGEPFGRVPYGPWVDSDIRPGHTYYYRVRGNDGSAWSPVGSTVSVTAATVSTEEPTVQIRVNAAHSAGPFKHKWEIALGSEHLSYMFKGDINEHVKAAGAGLRAGNKLAHDTLGIQYIRAHGILMDDLSVYTEDAAGNPRYDWTKVDRLYDMLRQDGLKPFVELSFMPKALAAERHAPKIFKYKGNSSPPKDYAKWRALVAALAKHLIDRYGRAEVETWPFEVWNEPDVKVEVTFWNGSRDEYFKLYDYAADGLKSVDPNLKVGGPVAAFTYFQEPFLRHVTSENFATGAHRAPLDFLDLHNYYLPASDYRPLLRRYGLAEVPVYYTEWGVSPEYGDKVNDTAYAAAETVSGLADSLDLVASISYWTASDYFEESGDPKKLFHGGFGLIGLDGLRKPRYWAYYLLHQLGTEKLAVSGSGDGFGGLVKTLATRGPFASGNLDGGVEVLLSNATPEHDKSAGSALNRHIALTVSGLMPGVSYRVEHNRIDNDHSNVYGAWKAMGSPRWPDGGQMGELHQRDELQALVPPGTVTANQQGEVMLEFDLPMPGVSMVKMSPE
jgi:xylan 1,4-beta-xylosidase